MQKLLNYTITDYQHWVHQFCGCRPNHEPMAAPVVPLFLEMQMHANSPIFAPLPPERPAHKQRQKLVCMFDKDFNTCIPGQY